MSDIDNRYLWGCDSNQAHFWHWYNYLTERLTAKVDIENVPDTIDKNFLIRRLMLDGKIAFFDDNGVTAYNYSNVETLDKYGRTKKILVNYRYGNQQNQNTYSEDEFVLVFSKKSVSLNRGVGFISEICRTATILANIDTTFNIQLENDRIIAIVSALTDTDITAVNELFKKMRNGQNVICVKKNLIEDISVNPLVKTVNHNYDEYQKAVQYYKAEFFNDIGINAMTTSKKERLVTDEVNANEESVYFSFNSVIDEINGGLKKVNEKFNTNMFAVEKKFKGSESDDKLSENNDD
jgi:hypothetical protein